MDNSLKLYKPVMIDDEEKKEIPYDLDSLTASSVINAVKKLGKSGHVVTVQETDLMLHAALFADAAGIDYIDVQRFHAKDFSKAGRLVRDFLFLDSEDFPEENS